MAEILLDTIDFYARINAAVLAAGGAAAFARAKGLPEQSVRDAWSTKSISKEVARAVGLHKVLRYPVISTPSNLVAERVIQEKLSSFIRQHATQRAAASALGLHETTLSKITNSERGLSPVLAQLGFGLPVVRFIPAKQAA